MLTGSTKLVSKRTRRHGLWTEEDLRAAMAAIKGKQMTSSAAANRYGIPGRTLRNHMRNGSEVKQLSRKSTFDKLQEIQLVKRIFNLSKTGISVTPQFIRKQAFDFCLENNIKHNFAITTGLAGSYWYTGFLKRHPQLKTIIKEGAYID